MSTNTESLSVILPVYNEERNIDTVVTKIITNVSNVTGNFEVILVNDGSTDGTQGIIECLATKYTPVRLLHNKRNKGYGAALREGIYNANKKWLLIMDADGQFEINDLNDFWYIKSSYDFILGYRKKRIDNFYRRSLGTLGNSIANLFLKTDARIKDINCGFKLFKTEGLKKISFVSTGGIINFEIIQKMCRHRQSFSQVPVTHYKRKEGEATGGKLKIILKITLEFFKLILSK